MKNSIKTGIGVFILGMGIIISSCVKDDPDIPPESTIPFDPDKVLTIQDIKVIKDTSGGYTFDDIYSVYAVVGMDEESGNIYKAAYVQDETGGIQLNFLNAGGLYLGDSIRVMLQGGTVDDYGGLYQINNLDVGRNIVKLATNKEPDPIVLTIQEVNANLANYQSMVIQIDSVQFVDGDLGKTYADSVTKETGEVYLEDESGSTILVRTSGYANFSNHTLAEGKGTFTSILTEYNGTAQLIIRDIAEVDLSGQRSGGGGGNEPIPPVQGVNEPFNNAEDYADYTQDGWSNFAVTGDRKWQGKTFNSEKYVQSTGYNSGLADMETWLITPPVINTNGDKKLNFKTAMAFWAHNSTDPITILASTDYDGTNFETSNWTPLSADLANASSGDNNWIESGEVSLEQFVGNVAIAFKYKGSETESTSIRIDDVVINASGGGGIEPVEEVMEYFDSVENYTNIDLPGWSNLVVAGDRYWQGKEYSGNKYAQATGYNSGLPDMETWMITPLVINTNGDKVLTFKCAQAYWAHNVNDPITDKRERKGIGKGRPF